jgi:predicted CXXCH cytochrome family protein
MNLHANSKPVARALFIGVLAVLISLADALLITPATGADADETQQVPDEIIIDNKVYQTDRKGPVWFSHLEHAEGYAGSCEACHHDYQNGKNIWKEGLPVAKCSKCHDPDHSSGSLKKLRIAYHKSCKGCHERLASEGRTSAPYKQCTDCHEL